MDFFKKLGKALLFPHVAVLIVLLVASLPMLVLAFVKPTVPLNYISYALSAYTLTVWCVRLPRIITAAKAFKNENKLVSRLLNDGHFQANVSLYATLIFNTVYAIFQLGLGVYNASVWYCSLAAYYFLLALMRLFLLRYTRAYEPREQIKTEYKKYRLCGYLLLIMNLALTAILFFIIAKGKTFVHSEIMTIAIAAFTFTALTLAIVNLIKYRKYSSPVLTASKIISLASACVSMLTLESTMLTTFGQDGEALTSDLLMSISGGTVSVFITAMAVYMVAQATKKLKEIKLTENTNE